MGLENKLKVILFGTHPFASNGYSNVVYHLSKQLANYKDIQLTIFGFQHFYQIDNHRTDFPPNVQVFDALAHENPKTNGFGIELVEDFVKQQRPDVCIIYNDSTIVSAFLQKIRGSGVPTKIIIYYDQVTPYQKKEYIDLINRMSDMVVTFTPYWEEVVKDLGCTLPTDYLCHGIDDNTYFPIPKDVARRYFSLNPDDFIILNTNRNQPRKRLDIMMKVFAEVVSRYPDSNIKLLIGTSLTGAWNLMDIYERELKKRGVSFEVGKKHLIVIDRAQRLSDHENCLLLNTADIGINTCEGAGFELIQVEMGLCGKPQIVPNIGGLQESFDETCSYVVEPTLAYYIDSSRDGVGGEAMLCDYMDFVDGIVNYYENRDLIVKHGAILRDRFLRKYRWKDIGKKFYNQILKVVPEWTALQKNKHTDSIDTEIQELNAEVEKIDIASIKKIVEPNTGVSPINEQSQVLKQQPVPVPSLKSIGGKRQRSRKIKRGATTTAELKKLRRKIDVLLSNMASDSSGDEKEQ